jgi:hypothetical protein
MRWLAAIILLSSAIGTAAAAENQLTAEEKAAGWTLLFDGKSLDGWQTSSQKPSQRPVEQAALNPHRCGGYMPVYEQPLADFVLKLDFKIAPGTNSGVFFRTWPLEPRPGKDVGFNGLEIAIDDTQTAGYHDTGAIYDLAQPTRNAMRPAGEWNELELTCHQNQIEVAINGEVVNRMNLDEWTRPNRRPDGSEHKFDEAFKDHPRRGYIGLQDHGGDCWYKNIKLKELK